ncbi:hypothetical protein [Actinomadura sp. 6K520]|uniref:hypothetical protein n=1 Tax=Actinomadura sp. 6K520 TaxID=2530364 RepID=UPI00104CE666|nr:hypothetical protein [Actinomadura sp. 6K520]TDE39374.1 hypothetical protein E1289_00135 [Actinomadura sp. 6K520]
MARYRFLQPSPKEAAKESAASQGGAEVARSVWLPPYAPPALPLPTYSGPWRARWHLSLLALVMRRDGWKTELRTTGPRRLLRIYAKCTPTIGESVSVAWGDGAWWYQSSTGLWLTPCRKIELAADKLAILLTPWVATAFDPLRDEYL